MDINLDDLYFPTEEEIKESISLTSNEESEEPYPVAISNILVICSVHHGTTVAVTLITAAIHPESHRQQL